MKTIVISMDKLHQESITKVRRPFAKGTAVIPSKKTYTRRSRNRKDEYGG